MDIYTYYQEQYDNTVALKDAMLRSGYNATVVLTLNKILNRFKCVLNEYSIAKEELDDIATSSQYFGNNRLQLEEHIRTLEQLKSQLQSIIKGVDELKLNQLQSNSMNSIFTQEDKTRCINNSRNAFPDCIPIDAPTIKNNLYLIKDKELEEYNIRFSDFARLTEEAYNGLNSNELSETSVSALADIYVLLLNTYTILETIQLAISNTNQYNTNVENIMESNPDYEDYEKFYNEHIELIELISELYNDTTSKFDKILSGICN